jgi:hypothetical protein
VQDGVAVPSAPATAQELLARYRDWSSYTTALVDERGRVVDLELHIQRLMR